MPNAKAKGRGRTKLGENRPKRNPASGPLERRVGPRAGTMLRPPTEPKTKAGGPA